MKTVTDVKGLSNLGTATTKRLHAKPPQGGTAHLEMYLLGKEKQRLDQELAHLEQRRERIHRRLKGITEELGRLHQVAQQEEAGELTDGAGGGATPNPAKSPSRHWKTMPLEY